MTIEDQEKSIQLHEQAMDLAELGDYQRRKNFLSESKESFKQAYELELKCLNMIPEGEESEPTWSVVCRSAMWLAKDAGKYQEALKLSLKLREKTPYQEFKDECDELIQELESSNEKD